MSKANFKSVNKYYRYIVSIIFVFLIVSLVRNMLTLVKSTQKVEKAKNEVVTIEKENKELESQIQEIESRFYVEKQARDELGLAYEGETVIILPPEDELRKLAPKIEEDKPVELPKPNWKLWLELFM